MVVLTDALLNSKSGGFTREETAKVMGGNALRFFSENFPSSASEKRERK